VKVLVIARAFAFHGGVERATEGLLPALRAAGHEVHLLTPGRAPAAPGITVHRLPLPRLPAAARALALPLLARAIVRRSTWDIVQSHERTLCQDVYRAGEGSHRAYLDSVGERGRSLHHRVVLALERRVFAASPQVAAIARRGADEIARLHAVPADRLSVVYNGVDLVRFHPDNRRRHRAAAREAAGVPEGAWCALFVGSGFARKGLAVALEALARLDDRASRLLVVGRGDTGRYRALAAARGVAERVAWLGARPDVQRWYAAADALVLPTLYEPFGNVHLEALASGLPVVTSTHAGGAEVVPPAAGTAVDPHHPDSVAAALHALRGSDPGRLATAARAAAEPFTHARQVEGFERVWRRARANGARPCR
jgi:UDP-glucose:(heptosyl)LPS alpha-1,3-glucosyltransferase